MKNELFFYVQDGDMVIHKEVLHTIIYFHSILLTNKTQAHSSTPYLVINFSLYK